MKSIATIFPEALATTTQQPVVSVSEKPELETSLREVAVDALRQTAVSVEVPHRRLGGAWMGRYQQKIIAAEGRPFRLYPGAMQVLNKRLHVRGVLSVCRSAGRQQRRGGGNGSGRRGAKVETKPAEARQQKHGGEEGAA